MGNLCSPSEEEIREEEKNYLKCFVNGLSEGSDLRVNTSIQMFCSLASSDHLRKHYQKRKTKADKDWIKSLAEKLGGFTAAPELAGLGALAVAVLIDIMSATPPRESAKDALRCVFAEEKASEVWDLIEEFLNTYRMYIRKIDQLMGNIEQIEWQLSAALTNLENSIMRDGHMSSPALKAWVNGAAFHVQMLIHLVRLGGIQSCDPVERLLYDYETDLDLLFEKHKEVIAEQCSITERAVLLAPAARYLVDEESKLHLMFPYSGYDTYSELYYDHRYGGQKSDIQQYFNDVRQNLQKLVHQRGSITVS